MKQQAVVSLGILGKESHFPFTGIFSAAQQSTLGHFSAVGRIHDADIKRDFRQTIQFSMDLKHLIESHVGTIKSLFRAVWDWYHESKSHSQIVCLVVQAMTPDGDLWLSMIGASGIWGAKDGVWYPLLADGSSVLMDKEIEGYPMMVQVSPDPEQLVVIPKPFQNVLPSAASFEKRLYEVSNVQ